MYGSIIDHFAKLCRAYTKVEFVPLFDKRIAKAQESSAHEAQQSYSQAFDGLLKGAYSIALDPLGDEVDSVEFSTLLKDRARVNFFIGGAYGFEREFLTQCDKVVSFGKITLSHKVTKVVLAEQIYRGFTLLHNHPYHK